VITSYSIIRIEPIEMKEVMNRMIVAEATMDTCQHALHADEWHWHHGDDIIFLFPCFHVGFYIDQVLKKPNALNKDKKVDFSHFFL